MLYDPGTGTMALKERMISLSEPRRRHVLSTAHDVQQNTAALLVSLQPLKTSVLLQLFYTPRLEASFSLQS